MQVKFGTFLPIHHDEFLFLLNRKYIFVSLSDVPWVRFSGLDSGRIQHILNKPDRIRTAVLFKFPEQDQVFKFLFFVFDANTIIKNFLQRFRGNNVVRINRKCVKEALLHRTRSARIRRVFLKFTHVFT